MLNLLIKNYLLELKMKGSSGHTVSNYSYHLQKFTAYLKETQLNYSSLTPVQIKAFRNRLLEAGLKPKTVNAVLSALKSFHDYLVEEGELKNNPVDTGRLRVKEGQSLPGFMSTEELEVFLQWLSKTPAHVALAFRTLLATGLRLSEAAWLTPADIILLDNKSCVLRVRHGKGDKERYTPVMDPGVASELLRLKGNRLDHKPLFRLSTHSFKSWARKCRLKTGLPFHTHRCRHTVGTQLLQKGIPLDKVQEVLGHADISTTRRYAKTAQEAIMDLAAGINLLKETRVRYIF